MPEDVWEAVPNVVASTLAQVMGPDIPIDPMIAFRYFKNGHLPEFVVYYFNWLQKTTGTAKRLSKSTIFCRSMHYIEDFREYMLNQAQVLTFDQPVEVKAEEETDPDAASGAQPDAPEAATGTEPEAEAGPEAEAEPEPEAED